MLLTLGSTSSRPVMAQAPLVAVASKLAEWAAEAAVVEGVGAMRDWLFSEDSDKPPPPIFGEETEAQGTPPPDDGCGLTRIFFLPRAQEPTKREFDLLAPDVRVATTKAVNSYFGLSSVPRNENFAARCLLYAARWGGVPAQRMLGYMYFYGEGHLAKDVGRYYLLEEKAAAQHDVIAIYNLGLAFCYDWGLPESSSTDIETRIRKCLALLRSAALQNFKPATKALRQLAKIGITD